LGPFGWLILGGKLAVLQAPLLDGSTYDPFSLFDDGFRPSEVGVAGVTFFRLS